MKVNADGMIEPYPPQSTRETKKFMNMKCGDLGSFIRLHHYLEDYLSEEQRANIDQANYCPFRSNKADEISESDLKFCRDKFFQKFIEYAQPSMLLCFTSKLKEVLVPQIDIKDEEKEQFFSKGRKKSFLAIHGYYQNISTYFLPHPNYPMINELRKTIWDHYFGSS